MENNFIYDIKTKVYFGENQLGNLTREINQYGKKVLLVYGGGSIKRNGLYEKIKNNITDSTIQLFEFAGIEPNPRHTTCNEAIKICKEKKIDLILAAGGGSVIDASKFIGAGTYYDGDVWDLVIGKAPITNCLPIISILTLAATGSEMDTGGVITNLITNDKQANGHELMRPKVSFLDPTNTYTVSKFQTAAGSADILSHLFEVYFNTQDEFYMLDTIMESLIKTVLKYAPIALNEPTNYEARANLMWASSWAINGFIDGCKNQAWSCHPIEHELSAYYDITHGLGLAILTPRWMEYCLDKSTVGKYYQYGVNVFNLDPNQDKFIVAKKAIDLTAHFLFDILGLESNLSSLGIGEEKFDIMASKASGENGIKGFKLLKKNDILHILKMCK